MPSDLRYRQLKPVVTKSDERGVLDNSYKPVTLEQSENLRIHPAIPAFREQLRDYADHTTRHTRCQAIKACLVLGKAG
jgi:hypothetical protein